MATIDIHIEIKAAKRSVQTSTTMVDVSLATPEESVPFVTSIVQDVVQNPTSPQNPFKLVGSSLPPLK